jgi:hypothetical protein
MRASASRTIESNLVNENRHDRAGAIEGKRRDWRHVHHSPWFWVGVAMFLTAILTYVFSEDLSLRPRLHGSAPGGAGAAAEPLPKP